MIFADCRDWSLTYSDREYVFMEFKIATWNMNCWQQSKKPLYDAAWQYLDSLDNDITLIQEAVPPEDYPYVVWNEIDRKSRPWGSGIVSRKWRLQKITKARSAHYGEEVDLLRTWRGAVAIAKVELPDQSPLTAISCYGLIDENYAQTTIYRIIADLIPLFDSKFGKRVIFAGDLNISSQMRGKRERRRHQAILESIKSLGLVDCLEQTKIQRQSLPDCPCMEAPNCGHVVTHRHNRGARMHIDYMFATEPLAEKLVDCYPVDEQSGFPSKEDGDWMLSDHCPVVAEFDL
jgi:exonuclease III